MAWATSYEWGIYSSTWEAMANSKKENVLIKDKQLHSKPFIKTGKSICKTEKRHRCAEQTLGLCGRRRGWDVQREQH